jgi:hypothetical protein
MKAIAWIILFLAINLSGQAAPLLQILSPTNGSVLSSPTSLLLTASATSPEGIANLIWYSGSAALTTSTVAPFAYNFLVTNNGAYIIKAVARDNRGAETAASIGLNVKDPPFVQILSPINGSVFTSLAPLDFTASATSADGILNLIWYSGSTALSTSTVPPFLYTLSPTNGSYLIKATASDNHGAENSAAIGFEVKTGQPPPPQRPTVSITSPTNNQSFTAPASVTVTASAADADGTITKVDFNFAGTLVGSAASAPYVFTTNGLAAGSYQITALATDNDAQSTLSGAINITVNPFIPPQPPDTNQTVHAGADQTVQLSWYVYQFDQDYATNYAAQCAVDVGSGWGPTYDFFNHFINGHLNMYMATQDTAYINRVLGWCETMMSKATILDYAGKKNWAGNWNASSTYANTNINSSLEDNEACQAIARCAGMIISTPDLRAVYGSRAQAVYEFIRDHMENKFIFTRNGLPNLYQNVADTNRAIGNNSLLILKMTIWLQAASEVLGGADNKTYGYPTIATNLAQGFVDHNKGVPRFTALGTGIIWDNGKNTFNPVYGTSYSAEDTSHASEYVDSLIEAWRLKVVFGINYPNGLANLFTETIWDRSTSDPKFNNFIDGSNGQFYIPGDPPPGQAPYANGNIYGGWSQLALFTTNAWAVTTNVFRKIVSGYSNASLEKNSSRHGRTLIASHAALAEAGHNPQYATLIGSSTVAGATSTNWSRQSGPGTATINTPRRSKTTVVFSGPGTNVFLFAVSNATNTYTDTMTVTVLPAPGVSSGVVMVNDDGSSVTYSGTWVDNAIAGGRIYGDEHYSNSTGASAQFAFTGTGVTWVCTKAANRGHADVYIDNVFQTTVDAYAAANQYQVNGYTKTGLANGPHTIKIVCKGTKNGNSSGTYIDVDGFRIQAGGVTTTQVVIPVILLVIGALLLVLALLFLIKKYYR